MHIHYYGNVSDHYIFLLIDVLNFTLSLFSFFNMFSLPQSYMSKLTLLKLLQKLSVQKNFICIIKSNKKKKTK